MPTTANAPGYQLNSRIDNYGEVAFRRLGIPVGPGARVPVGPEQDALREVRPEAGHDVHEPHLGIEDRGIVVERVGGHLGRVAAKRSHEKREAGIVGGRPGRQARSGVT